ncbi:MAG: hypothetical protein EXR94_06170 [Gemmatimonadetes bacterium]|nr:hypothetical protein [Gemmatimonadota bacterium]
MEVHVLLNPASGDGRGRRRWRELGPAVREIFPALQVHESRAAGDLRRIAAELRRHDGLVLAAGGDGTSHEVLNGLLEDGPAVATMGWIPIGSGNDLARTMGVPRTGTGPVAAYRSYRPVAIDVGRLEYRDADGRARSVWFGNSFTLGVSADVLGIVVREGKRLGGPLSYCLGALRAMARHHAIGARFTIDNDTVDPGPCRLISVTNGPTFGAGMRISPAAKVDDGHLDLVWFSRVSRLGMLGVFPKIYWGGHLNHPAVTSRPVQRLEIQTDGPQHFEIDGELGFGFPPFRIGIAPQGLRVARFGTP